MTTTRGVLATLVGAMLVAVVAAPHGAAQSTPTPTSTPDASTTTTSTTEPATDPTLPSGTVGGLAATTNLAFTFVDSSRPTPCTGAASRTLPVMVYFPSTGASFPVVLVGPGTGASQRAVAKADAQAFADRGYLAVALSFPCTNLPGASLTDPNVLLDIYRQPGDVSFVLSSLLTKSSTGGDPLFGLLDPGRVGYIGSSGGAVTGLLFFNTCCTDARIRAVVAIKGFPIPTNAGLPATGSYEWTRPIALFLWAACFDIVTPYAPAYAAFLSASPPKFFVQHPTGGHFTPATFPPGTYDAFFDRYAALDLSPTLLTTLLAAGADPYYAYDLGIPGIGARLTVPPCVSFTG